VLGCSGLSQANAGAVASERASRKARAVRKKGVAKERAGGRCKIGNKGDANKKAHKNRLHLIAQTARSR